MIKKILSFCLSIMMVFGLASPSFANINDEYFKDYQKIYEKSLKGSKSESKSKFQIVLEGINQLEEMGLKDLKVDIDFNTVASSTVDPLKADITLDMKVDVKSDSKQVKEILRDINLNIPQIRILLDKEAMYLNKDIVNYFIQMAGSTERLEQDYIKAGYGLEGMEQMESMTKTMKDQDKMLQAIMNFLKKIDLGDVSLDLQKNGNIYTANWDSDKMVEIGNALLKYVFLNFEDVVDFYEDLGIDYMQIINAQNEVLGAEKVTKEQMSSQLKEIYGQISKDIDKNLPLVKKLLQGSTISMKEDFTEDNYSADVKMNFVVNLEQLKQLSEDIDISGKVKFNLESTSKVSFPEDIQIKMPENAFLVDEEVVNAFMEGFNEGLEEDLADDMEDEEPIAKIIIDTKNKSYELYLDDEKIDDGGKIEVSMENGQVSVDSQELANILEIFITPEAKGLITSKKMFTVRDLKEENIMGDAVQVQWDNSTKSVSIIF